MPTGPVLVVEDDDDIREVTAQLLEFEGFRTLAAAHGAEALEVLRTHLDTCLILLDLSMPVMDGRAFRQHQLADPKLASIPVIVISAIADCEQVAQELKAAGCYRKPIPWDELLQQLDAYR